VSKCYYIIVHPSGLV